MKTEKIIEKLDSLKVFILPDDIWVYDQYLRDVPYGNLLDIGTGWGKSVIAMALINENLEIDTFDYGVDPIKTNGWANDNEDYRKKIIDRFYKFGVEHVYFQLVDVLTFPVVERDYDFFHLDLSANTEAAVLKRWFKAVKPGGLIFIRNYERFKPQADKVCEGCEYLPRRSGSLIQVVRKS